MKVDNVFFIMVGILVASQTTTAFSFANNNNLKKDTCCGNTCQGCCVWEGDICTSELLNVTQGHLLPNIGGHGGGGFCQKWKSGTNCNAAFNQLIKPQDFDLDPTEQYLFVADAGYDEASYGTGNSSRLLRFDLKNPEKGPSIISHCGQFKRVKYDAPRNQLVVLRITKWNTLGQQHGGTEILRFDPMETEAEDVVCAAKFDTNPSLKGKTIARKGLVQDAILPASTMYLLGESKEARNSVLVGDQNQYCVLAYPLDGSFGSKKAGIPVAGTCGKSAEVGVPVDTNGKAGSVLSLSNYQLEYVMFPSANDPAKPGELPSTVMLHDMNHGTIDLGNSPKAKTNFKMIPILSASSSDYFFPLWDRRADPLNPELIVVDNFGKDAASRAKKGNSGDWKNGYDGGHGQRLFDITSWEATYADIHNQTNPLQGLPIHWMFQSNGKLLALMTYTYQTAGIVDNAFVEFDVPV